MTQRSLEDILREFFPSTDPDHIHVGLHRMIDEVNLGRLALLPRVELAEQALLADGLMRLIGQLYSSFVSECGDDPNGWGLTDGVHRNIGDLFALYLSRQPAGHTADVGVPATGAVVRQASRQRRKLRQYRRPA